MPPTTPRRRQRAPAESITQPRTSIADPVRESLRAMARITGLERVARAMERFATSADRAAAVLEKLDAQRLERLLASADRVADVMERIDTERLGEMADVLDRLRTLADTADQMNRSLRAIEQLALDTRRLVTGPLNRLPIPGRLRIGAERPQTSATP
jgi:hypothetical protein